MDPALEFCMSASVCEMRGDYNFEKRCKAAPPGNTDIYLFDRGRHTLWRLFESRPSVTSQNMLHRPRSGSPRAAGV